MQYLSWLGTGLRFGGPLLFCDPKMNMLSERFVYESEIYLYMS